MATASVQISVLIVIMTVIFTSSPVTGCRDRHVWIADGSYSCKGLLDPADTDGLYQKRDYFCNTYKLTYCCQTCKLVNEDLTKQELQSKEFQKLQLRKKELKKEQIKRKEIRKPLVVKNQLPNVIVSGNSYLTSRPENVFQQWFSTLYQYFQSLSESKNLYNQV